MLSRYKIIKADGKYRIGRLQTTVIGRGYYKMVKGEDGEPLGYSSNYAARTKIKELEKNDPA